MRRDLEDRGILSTCKFGTYRLGCVRGGGDWNTVSAIIDRIMPDIDVHVYDRADTENPGALKERLLTHWRELHGVTA